MNKSVVDQIFKLSCETKTTETAKSYQSKYYFHSDQFEYIWYMNIAKKRHKCSKLM